MVGGIHTLAPLVPLETRSLGVEHDGRESGPRGPSRRSSREPNRTVLENAVRMGYGRFEGFRHTLVEIYHAATNWPGPTRETNPDDKVHTAYSDRFETCHVAGGRSHSEPSHNTPRLSNTRFIQLQSMTVINNYTNIDYLRMGGGLRFKKGNFGGGGA